MADAVIAATILIGVMIRTRLAYVIVLLSILIELALAILQNSGLPLPTLLSFTPLATWFWFTLALGFVFGTVTLVTRNLRSGLDSARRESEARHRAEITLRESESRLTQIASTMHEVVWLRDAQTLEILYVNPAYETVWGRSCASLYEDPTSFVDAVHLDDKDRVMKAIAAQRQANAPFNEEYRIIQPNGHERWVWGRTFPIKDETGKVCRVSALVVDITERKRAEAEIQHKTEHLQALRQIGNEITAELDQDTVLRSITASALKLCGGITSNLYLYRRELEVIECIASTGPALVTSQTTRRQGEGLFGKVWETDAPVLVNDYCSSGDWSTDKDVFPSRAVLGVPIRYGNEFLGVLNVMGDPPKTYSPADVETLAMFADQAAIAIKNAELYASVQQQTMTDALTGVFNRRGLFQLGEREVERSLRFHHPLTAIMLDIDHFKQVNDTYGHPTGDRVLGKLADTCRDQVRTVDIVARYGGEEFMLLLPETDLAHAAEAAERLRQAIEQMRTPLEPTAELTDRSVQVTVSLGVVELGPDTRNLTGIIEGSDRAMYKAKQAGRNRVAVGA